MSDRIPVLRRLDASGKWQDKSRVVDDAAAYIDASAPEFKGAVRKAALELLLELLQDITRDSDEVHEFGQAFRFRVEDALKDRTDPT